MSDFIWESPEASKVRALCKNILDRLDACVAERKRIGVPVCTAPCDEREYRSPFYEIDATVQERVDLNERANQDRIDSNSKYEARKLEEEKRVSGSGNNEFGRVHLQDNAREGDQEQEETTSKPSFQASSDPRGSEIASGSSFDSSWGNASIDTILTDPDEYEFYISGNVAKVNWIEWLKLLESSKWTVSELLHFRNDLDNIIEEPSYNLIPNTDHDIENPTDSDSSKEHSNDERKLVEPQVVKFRRLYAGAESAWIENPWKYWNASVLDPRIRGRLLVGPLRYPDGVTGMAVGLSERNGEIHNRIHDAARLYAPLALYARRYLQEGRGMEVFHIDQFFMQGIGYGRITQSVTYLHSTSQVGRCKPSASSSLITVGRGGSPSTSFDSRKQWRFERPSLLVSAKRIQKPNPADNDYYVHLARSPGMVVTGREAVSELTLVVHAQELGFVSMFVPFEPLIVTTKSSLDGVRSQIGRRLSAVFDPAAMLLGDIREMAVRVRETQELLFEPLAHRTEPVSYEDVVEDVIDVGFDGIARAAFRDFIESNPLWLEGGKRMAKREIQEQIVRGINSYLNGLQVDQFRKRCIKEASRVWYEECPPVPWLWNICNDLPEEETITTTLQILRDWCMTGDECIIVSYAEYHHHEVAAQKTALNDFMEDIESQDSFTTYLACYPDEGVDLDPDDEYAGWCLKSEARVVRERHDKIVFKLEQTTRCLPIRRGFEIIHALFLFEHIEDHSWLVLRPSAKKVELKRNLNGQEIIDFLRPNLTSLVIGESRGDSVSPSWTVDGIQALAGKRKLFEEDVDTLEDDILSNLKDWILLALVFGGYASPRHDSSCALVLQGCIPSMEVIWPEPIGELSDLICLPESSLRAEDIDRGYLSLAWDERSWIVAHGSVLATEEGHKWHLDASVGLFDYPLGRVSNSVVKVGDYWSSLQRTVAVEPLIRGDIRYLEVGGHTLREVLDILSTTYELNFVTAKIAEEDQWGLWIQKKHRRLSRALRSIRSISIRDVAISIDPAPVGRAEAAFRGAGWMVTSLTDLQHVVLKHVQAVDKSDRSAELGCGAKELTSAILLGARLWKNLPVTGFTRWLDTLGASQEREGAFRVDKKARLPLCVGIAAREDGENRKILMLLQSGSAYCASVEDIHSSNSDVVGLHLRDAFVEDVSSGYVGYCFYKQSGRAEMY